MKNLLIDIVLTFTIVPAVLGSIFYYNVNNATGYKSEPVILTKNVKAKSNLSKIDQYVERFKDVAVSEQKLYGIPASITLAQGILESASGNSKLCQSTNNHFGVKCFEKRCHNGHCQQFSDDKPTDRFKVYPTAWQSFRDHSKFLCKPLYAKLRGKNYKVFAKGLYKKYATKESYPADLIKVIEDNNLQRFDN
jgi:flagellum-specific peptidoglycan hydrolase FlgJ